MKMSIPQTFLLAVYAGFLLSLGVLLSVQMGGGMTGVTYSASGVASLARRPTASPQQYGRGDGATNQQLRGPRPSAGPAVHLQPGAGQVSVRLLRHSVRCGAFRTKQYAWSCPRLHARPWHLGSKLHVASVSAAFSLCAGLTMIVLTGAELVTGNFAIMAVGCGATRALQPCCQKLHRACSAALLSEAPPRTAQPVPGRRLAVAG